MTEHAHKIPDIVEKSPESVRVRRLATRMRYHAKHRNLTDVGRVTNLRDQENIIVGGFAEVSTPSSRSLITDEIIDQWLENAVNESEASTMDDVPEGLIDESRRIIRGLRDYLPYDTDVYIVEGEGIAVEVFGEPGYAYLMICELGGDVRCFVTVNGIARSAHYKSSKRLPDGFLREGLEHMSPTNVYKRSTF